MSLQLEEENRGHRSQLVELDEEQLEDDDELEQLEDEEHPPEQLEDDEEHPHCPEHPAEQLEDEEDEAEQHGLHPSGPDGHRNVETEDELQSSGSSQQILFRSLYVIRFG